MVGNGTDRTENPDDNPSGPGDPERLRIAGALANVLGFPMARVRRHLTKVAAAGVVRVQPDRRTSRLDPDTLRWAADQVGPTREV